MFKKISVYVIILTFLMSSSIFASNSMEYLANQSLTNEFNNYRSLAMVTKTLSTMGVDTTSLQNKLSFVNAEQDLRTKAFKLLATSNPDIAETFTANQTYNGSWNNDIYLTGLITYILRETGLETNTAQNGANYLRNHPNDDGGWGNNGTSGPMDTALAVMALKKSNYNDDITQKGLQWLLLHQGGEGGWGNHINTAWACLALHELGTNPDELEKAVDYLKLLINKDGGWGIYPGEASDPFTSALVLLALHKYDSTLSEVAKGLAYMQKLVEDEAWVNKALAYYNISEIYHLLWDDPEFASIKGSYLSFLKEFPDQQNYDYLARKISLMAKTGEDAAELVTQLLAGQNPDGGWGFGPGYSSDPLDTALALRALLDSGYADFAGYQKVLAYFNSHQNSDGSFSIKKNSDGQVYLTALIVEELERLNKVLDCSYITNSSRQWLINQKNGSGGYGDGMLETARTLRVIINDLYSSELESALAYIDESKLTNGSWNEDALTTAAVLSVLNRVKPNLTISAADLVFTPEVTYLNGNTTINVTIRNTGLAKAENIAVRLYDGAPGIGTLIGTETIALLAPQQNAVAVFTWNATTTGAHEFTVVIDADNQISESDENDNRASKILNVLPKVDLSLAIGDIIITPEDPGPADTLTIKAMVRNLGYLDSGAFKVVFYNGDPEAGGIALAAVDCLNVPGQGVAEVSFSAKLPEGNYQIYAVVDSENQIIEDKEDNNRSSRELTIEKRVDLAISYHNIVFSKDDPIEGDLVTIYATVVNKREEPVGNVPVAFYLGNPTEDGQLMGTVVLDQISGNSTALAELNWNTAGITDRQLIYVLVDPENTVKEVDKSNNQALQIIYISARPDLTGTVTAYNMSEGTPGNILISVKNQGGIPASNVKVRVFLGEIATGRQLGEDIVISSIAAGGANNITVTLDTVNLAGTRMVSVQIDPEEAINEFNESNNEFSATFTVNPPIELEISGLDFTSSPSVIDEGDLVTFEAVIKNTSSTSVSNVIVRFYRYVENDWVQLGEGKVNLSGNQSQAVSFTWDSNYHLGSNSFKVEVDPDGNIYERDKNNNIVIKEFEVRAAQMPDLMVDAASIVTAPNLVARGTTCILRAEVSNLRAVTVSEVTVRFYDGDPDASGTIIGEQVIDLPGRGSAVAEVNWDTSQVKGYREIYVWADPVNTIPEYDEANNRASRVIFLRADLSYQPQNVKATVDYHDVTLSWEPVEQPDVLGYLVYRDGSLLNQSVTGVHRTVAASSTYSTSSSYAPGNAIDGNENTYWYSKYDKTHWFEEEFPKHQYVEWIEILWNSVNPLINYQIQIWDGETYQTVATVPGDTQNPSICKLGTNGLLIKKYRIVISSPSNFYAIIKEINIHTREFNQTLSYLDSVLPSGNYEYTVTALDNQGEESIPSLPVKVSILPPVAPTNFKAEVKGPNVHLSWDQSIASDCVGYYLLKDGAFLGETEPVSGTPTAFASQSSSYGPEKAMDKNESSSWYYTSTTVLTGWWQMDLLLKKYISSVKINWQYTPSDFEILAWHNNNWVKIAEVKNNQQGINEIIFNQVYKTDKIRVNILKPYISGSYRYFGIKEINFEAQKLITGLAFQDNLLKTKQYQYSLTAENSVACESEPVQLTVTVNPPEQPTDVSLEVNGRDVALSWDHRQETDFAGYYIIRNGRLLPSGLEPVDIGALGKASASSCYSTSTSYQPENALDRNSSTSWYSAYGVFPSWFMAELPSMKVIMGIKVTWYSSYYSAKDFLIQYRQNDNWYTIQRLADQNIEEGIYNFPHPVKTDALRLFCTKGNGYYLMLRELYIYEEQPVTTMNYLDRNLRDGNYNYSIFAADKAGNWGLPSVPVTVTIGEIPTPQNLRANVKDTSVSMQWEMSKMDSVAGFRIYRDYRAVNELRNVADACTVQVSANQSYASRLNDNNKNTYWYPGYRIYPATVELTHPQAMDLSKIVVQWSSAAATDYNVLAWINDAWTTIQEIRGNTELSNEINLNQILGATKVKLEILAGPNYIYLAELELFDANLIKTTTYTDSVLENRIYTYYVRAVSAGNTLSEASNSVSVTIDEKIPPEKPTGFSVTEQNNSLLLKWNPNTESDLAGYNIYLGDSIQPINTALIDKLSNQYPYNLSIGIKEYAFKLVAVDINGNQSIPADAYFQFNQPAVPTGLNITPNNKDLTLSWNAVPDLSILGYKVFRDNVLLNSTSRLNPIEIITSSVYYNNNSYSGNNVNDTNSSTFWRPAIIDSAPYLELRYSNKQQLSSIKVTWYSVEAIPNDYSVQAFVNGSWIVLMNGSQTLSQTIDLDSPVFTDRIRLQIPSGGLYSLAEFGGYSVSSYITACSYIDRNLLPGEYQYHVVAVNRAGLQSRKSEPCLGVITEKDLSVHINEVYLYPKKPSILDQVTVQAIIRNNGEQNISNVKVKFFLDDDPNCFFETVIPEMEAKQDIFVRTSVDYLGEAGKHNLFVKVDPDNSITEYDETNNEALKSIEIVEQRSFVSHINSIDSTKFTEIKLNLAVLDEENQGFNGLSYDNFTLTEDGVEQTIKSIRCISDTQTTKPKMDIVFVIDITGSMDSVIEGVKNNCLTLLDLLDSQNIDYNLGLTVFGDYVYIQNNGDLISSATTFRDWIIKIPRPDWGGDGPENALGALRDSIDGMHYRVDAQKIFVVITDAPSPSYSATPPPIPTLAGVLQQVKEVYGIVYVVGPTVESVKRAYGTNCPTDWIEEYQGDNSLPTQTGGKFYEIGTDFSTLVYDLAYEIIRRKSNYEIIYDTSNINRDGSERLVKINMNYRTVSGEANGKYLAPADSLSDLAISNMNLNPAYPNDQDTCTVRLKVNNLGGAVVTNVPIRLYLGDPRNMGLTIEESIIPELAPGAETMIEFTRAAKSGNYQLTAWVDPDDQIPEMNESNNLAHISMTVPGYQLPDLIVADIHHIPDVVFRGDRINLTAKVANLGASSSQIKVVCYDNLPERGGKILGERTINQLSYLQMADLSFDINTYNLTGDTTVYVIVDPLNQIFESDETNNNGRKNIHIYPRLIMGSIVANKTEYISNETALFDVRIENNQEQSWTGAAEVVIKDENNNIIAVIGHYNSLELDIPASGNNFWATTVSWNTGRCKPGNYIAQLNILDETSQHNNIIAEFSTIFRIAPNKYVNGEITTDKILYAPGESVRITIQHTNQSLNTNLDNLTGKVEIINSLEQLLWSQEYTINSLPMGLTDIQTFIWTTGTNATNEYLIRVTLFENEQILWNGTKTFTISSNVKFTGSLEVAPNKAIAGQMVDLIYSLLNKGNQSCEGLQLQFHFVNTVTDQVMKTLTTIHDLPISQSVSNILKYTVDLPDAQYMVIMLTEKNEETYPLSSAALLVDSTPPVTVAELSDQRLDKDGVLYGVLNSKLTLTAADNLSGVAETLLDIGAGFQPYNEPVTFPAEGKYIVRYKSIDRLGNEENVKELMVVIDETPPVAAIISPIDNQEVAPEFIVNLSASDNVGLDYFELYINDQKYATYNISPLEQILQLEPGIYILKVRAVDLAGYESWSAPVNIKVQKADTTPPVTIAEYPTDWTNQDATVILNATDDLSGVKETRFRINDGPWQAGTILQIITEGNHAIEFYSIDNAGNGEIVKSITVRLDRTKPVTEIKLTGDQKPDGSYQSNVTVNIKAIDNLNGSGINRIYYRIGVEGGYQPYTEPLVITTEGLNEVYAYAVDNAGNHEEPQRIEFKIVKGWESDYSLICNKLTIYGHLNVDRVFVNGQVNIYGHCNLNYLGTTEKTILKTGPSTIDQLRTEQPHQAIPAPDWEGLKKVTILRQEKQIPKNVTLNNVRFENSLMIAGTTKLSGLIVVKGDLTINGNVDLKDAGIFCSGKITFNGNVKGSGLIYATGLTAHGNPQLNGVIIVNGPVEASGSVGNNGVDLHKYLKWFK